MSSSNSYLEESRVWCPVDDESADNLSSGTLSTSTNTARAKAKHSGGSIDASGDVEIVDINDTEWQNYHRYCSRKLKKSGNPANRSVGKTKKTKHASISSVRGYGSTQKRRSSSFSKVFSCNRKHRSEVLGRRSSFGIKRNTKRGTFKADDDGISWQDRRASRNGTPVDYYLNISSKSDSDRPTHQKAARSESKNMSNTVFSKSIASRPSFASTTVRQSDHSRHDDNGFCEQPLFSMNDKRARRDRPVIVDEMKHGDPAIERMVENINVRNFIDKTDCQTLRRGENVKIFPNRIYWYLSIIACFLILTLLLLGLSAWHIQDAENLRNDIQEVRSLIHSSMNVSGRL